MAKSTWLHKADCGGEDSAICSNYFISRRAAKEIPLHSMNFNALFVKNILGGCLRWINRHMPFMKQRKKGGMWKMRQNVTTKEQLDPRHIKTHNRWISFALTLANTLTSPINQYGINQYGSTQKCETKLKYVYKWKSSIKILKKWHWFVSKSSSTRYFSLLTLETSWPLRPQSFLKITLGEPSKFNYFN